MEQVKFDKEYQLFIGGSWKKASDNCTMEVICRDTKFARKRFR